MKKIMPVTTISLHPRKKTGLFLGIVISILFLILYFYILMNLERVGAKVLIIILILVSFVFVFFNVMAFLVLKRERFVGFFLSSEGFNDISTGNNYGVVYWKDVLKMHIVDDLEHPKRKYIVLKVRNPQEYIDREPSVVKKRSLILKYHYYGSPVCFSERGLNCTFEELEHFVRLYYEDYRNNQDLSV